MDNLQNMMAEMQKMQQQMQEMAAKQAEEAAKEENKPAVKIADLELIARKLSQTEEAVAELYTFTEKISAVENAMQEVSDLITGLKQMLLENGATPEEENTILEELQTDFQKIIEENNYKDATKGSTDKHGDRVFSTLARTIRQFAGVMKKYAYYNKKMKYLDDVVKFTETLYRKIYVSRIMEYGLYCGNWNHEGKMCDNRTEPEYMICDHYIDSAYKFGGDGVSETDKEGAAALNAVRQDHLASMQNEAMELILAEVAKYI